MHILYLVDELKKLTCQLHDLVTPNDSQNMRQTIPNKDTILWPLSLAQLKVKQQKLRCQMSWNKTDRVISNKPPETQFKLT